MFTGIRRTGISGTQRVALTQAGLVPIVALIGLALDGFGTGLAAGYGVLVGLAVSTVLAWRERQSMRHPEWDQHRLMKMFIRAGIERLLLLVGLLIMGLGVFRLAPLPLLLGLLLAQFGWLAAATGRSNR